VKLAVVGAGSTYTPELVDGLVRMRDLLPLEELALSDPDAERLAILTGLTKRIPFPSSARSRRFRTAASPSGSRRSPTRGA
jgi:alpha-galactosidase/6-phospho-beta-glucosidase family protein